MKTFYRVTIFIVFYFFVQQVDLYAQILNLDSLYFSKPSDSERDQIIGSFNITLKDGDLGKWSSYDPYYFNPNDTMRSIYPLVNSLRVLREQKFSEPIPFTENLYEYMLSHFQLGGIELSLRSGSSYGGGNHIYLGASGASWVITPYVSKIGLLIHETRHSDPDDPGHDPDNPSLDFKFNSEGAYAREAIYFMWLYKYGINNSQMIKTFAADVAANLLRNRFEEKPPTHPNPKIQSLINELLLRPDPILTVSPDLLYIASTSNSTATFDITSNTGWTTGCLQRWLTVESTSGLGNASIKLTATANPTTAPRSATPIVYGPGVASGPNVIQFGAVPVLNVSANSFYLTSTANSTASFDISSNISITSNINWNVSSSQTWLTLNKSSGSENTTIIVTASANPTGNSRSAVVTVSCNGANSRTILVTQEALLTNIEDISISDVSLYPIPVIDKLVISFSKPISQYRVTIYSSNGIQVYSSEIAKNITQVDMSKYAPGVYLVNIVTSDRGPITKKIIKR